LNWVCTAIRRKVKLKYSIQERPSGEQNLLICCRFSSSFFVWRRDFLMQSSTRGARSFFRLGSTCHQFTHSHTKSFPCRHTNCTHSAPLPCHTKIPLLRVQLPNRDHKPSKANFTHLISVTLPIQPL